MEQKPKKPIYKKWWFWFLLVMIFAAIGRNSDDKTTQNDSASSQPVQQQSAAPAQAPAQQPEKKAEPAPAPTAYKVGQPVPVDKFTYTVNSVSNKKKIGNEYMNKQTEGTFLVLNVSIKNGDKEARMMDTSLFKIKDANGTEYDPFAEGDIYVNNDPLFLSNVNPGLTKKANVVFELPPDAKGLKLEVSSGMGFSAGQTESINLGK